MCNSTSGILPNSQRYHKNSAKHQHCWFKILKCSPQQLCILCFLFYYCSAGKCADLNVNSTKLPAIEVKLKPLSLHCNGEVCYLKISSNEKALKNMVAASEQLFDTYSTIENSTEYIDDRGLENFINDVGLVKEESHEGHDHEGHDHGDHEEHNHEGHDHGFYSAEQGNPEDYSDFYEAVFGDFGVEDSTTTSSTNSRKRRSTEISCISSIKDLVRSYFRPRPSEDLQMSLADFITLMPQILLDVKRPECRIEKEKDEEHNDNATVKNSLINVEHSTANVWLISFGSVALISLVSLMGVLLIPLLRHSHLLNQLIAFLIALAVGTLSGDALLHLLPHSSGLHDHGKGGDLGHEGHDHGAEESEEDHFNMMWKGLMACAGIYVFFVIESTMGLIHRRKTHKHENHEEENCGAEPPSTSSPLGSEMKNNKDDITVHYTSPTQSPLLKTSVPVQNGKMENCDSESLRPSPSQAPLIAINGNIKKQKSVKIEGHNCAIEIEDEEEPIDTGHHHHSHKVPQTIASLAWMVIVGDGLHNITDGLAIGAAFTSSIGAGLGTSLAIFFHEIPQELGDFAILLNAGMTVKQALLCNFLSASMCFIGLIIGLLVGEYTSGIILWILAFTAGGFLYIALVDMLPVMIKQLEHKDWKQRCLIQHAGLLCGFGLMVLIALKEDAFNGLF